MRRLKCARPPPRNAGNGLGSVPSLAAGVDRIPPQANSLQVRLLVARFGLTPLAKTCCNACRQSLWRAVTANKRLAAAKCVKRDAEGRI
jgi:hypothetical protein